MLLHFPSIVPVQLATWKRVFLGKPAPQMVKKFADFKNTNNFNNNKLIIH
jgi:hypothetical protein